MICPKCNQEIPDGSTFCTMCGANLQGEAPQAVPQPPQPPQPEMPPQAVPQPPQPMPPVQPNQPPVQQPVQQPFTPPVTQAPNAYQPAQPFAPVSPQPPKKKKTGLIIGIVAGAVALLIIIVLVIGLILAGSSKDPEIDSPGILESTTETTTQNSNYDPNEMPDCPYANTLAYLYYDIYDIYINDEVYWLDLSDKTFAYGETDTGATLTSFEDTVPAGAEVSIGLMIDNDPDQIIVCIALNETGSEASVSDCSIKLLATYFTTQNSNYYICGNIETTTDYNKVLEQFEAAGFVRDDDLINDADTAAEVIGRFGMVNTDDGSILILAGADEESVYAYSIDSDGVAMVFIGEFDYLSEV